MGLLFLNCFGGLEDPRVPGLVTYPLEELLLSTLSGLLSGAQDWEDVVTLGEAHLEWLRGYLPFVHGIACADTYQRVFRLLDSDALAARFVSWVATLTGRVTGVVAIDGKTSRGSRQDASGGGALHMLSAFAHESGLVIGQKATCGKGHEITAIPELLRVLALEGSVVTIDAMGAQRTIVQTVLAAGADYAIALKGNQGTLFEDVALFCKEASPDVAWDRTRTLDADHGRIEERTCLASSDIGWLQERHAWPGLQSIAQITAQRTDKKSGKTTSETRLFISSLPADATRLLAVTRAHWSIENTLHWSLDVTFRDDACRTRKDHAAANLATLRHAAFNLLKRCRSKGALKTKRLKAALNPSYRTQLINPS
jgi:predicted transposase YbfD/YdcC